MILEICMLLKMEEIEFLKLTPLEMLLTFLEMVIGEINTGE